MATKKSNKSLWVMLALIAAIIAVILLLPSCGNRNAKKGAETDAESTTLVKAGDTAPDFTVEMVDGSSVTLGDLKGKVVLATVGYDEHEFEELIRTIEKTLGN